MAIDPGTIIALLAAGAIAKVEGLGGQIVTDAYAGLKRVLTDTYGFVAGSLIEKRPKDDATLKAAAADVSDEAVRSPEVARLAKALDAALAKVSADQWQKAGVVIEGLNAKGTIELGSVSAGQRGVSIRTLKAGKDIKIGPITG